MQQDNTRVRSHLRVQGLMMGLTLWLVAGPACGVLRLGELEPEDPDTRIVASVVIEGNEALSDGQLLKGLETQAESLDPFGEKPLLDSVALALDERRLESIYASFGFFGAQVQGHDVTALDESTVRVVFRVVEGRRTMVKRVRFLGLQTSAKDDESVRRLAELRRRLPGVVTQRRGMPWSQRTYEESKSKVLEVFTRLGYLTAEVTGRVLVDREQYAATVQYTVTPGPLARIGEVQITGNRAVSTERILQRMAIDHGEILVREDLRRLERHVYELGVFYSVLVKPGDVLPSTGDSLPRIRLEVTVQEMPLHGVRAGIGLAMDNDRSEAYVLGGYENRDFIGGLRFLDFQLRPSLVVNPSFFEPETLAPAGTTELSFRQPSFLEEHLFLTSTVGYELGVEDDYRHHRFEFFVGFGRRIFDVLTVTAGLKVEQIRFFDVSEALRLPIAERIGLGFRDAYALRYAEQALTLDLRDNVIDAREGLYASLQFRESLEALGNQFEFFQANADLRAYWTPASWLTLAARARLGWTVVSESSETPLSIRFKGGGASSVRGFASGRMGPFLCESSIAVVEEGLQPGMLASEVATFFGRFGSQGSCPAGDDDKVFIGGDVIFESTFESRFTVASWLGLVAFVDVGEVWATGDSVRFDALQVAIGPGLRLITPVGPVRLDLGFLLTGNTTTSTFHLSLGQAF